MMSINRKLLMLLSALLVLFVASIACNLPFSSDDDTPTLEPIPVSENAVQQLEQNLQNSLASVAGGETVTLIVDQIQLTSLLATQIQYDPESPLTDVQVYLLDDQAQFRAKLQQSGISIPVVMDLTLYASDAGTIAYDVVEAKLGPLPMPDNILQQFTLGLDNALLSPESQLSEIFIEDLAITPGQMTLTGRSR
jgi:uncharacterized protein YpmS